MYMYKNVNLRSFNICISSIKINTHVCDKNVETVAITEGETKKLGKGIGVFFSRRCYNRESWLNNIKFLENWWRLMFYNAIILYRKNIQEID